MAISLNKGGNVSLSKESGGDLKEVIVGLGWNERATDGADFDLDASAFLLGESGKVRGDADFIFYNQLKSQDGSIEHLGDNLTGGGDGDDEQLVLRLADVPADIHRVVVAVTIHEAEERKQNFGMVEDAFVRVVNKANNKELARYDLSEDMSTETAMVFAEVYRRGGEWKFKAVGQGFAGGLGPLARSFGVQV